MCRAFELFTQMALVLVLDCTSDRVRVRVRKNHGNWKVMFEDVGNDEAIANGCFAYPHSKAPPWNAMRLAYRLVLARQACCERWARGPSSRETESFDVTISPVRYPNPISKPDFDRR